jgi:hypothetical protein
MLKQSLPVREFGVRAYYSKFQVDISCSSKVMDPVHILVNTQFKWKMGITITIWSRVMGLVGYDVDFDGE